MCRSSRPCGTFNGAGDHSVRRLRALDSSLTGIAWFMALVLVVSPLSTSSIAWPPPWGLFWLSGSCIETLLRGYSSFSVWSVLTWICALTAIALSRATLSSYQ
ncbi:hypothetical protein V8D89_004997, partial [Ganoderma adspersum]